MAVVMHRQRHVCLYEHSRKADITWLSLWASVLLSQLLLLLSVLLQICTNMHKLILAGSAGDLHCLHDPEDAVCHDRQVLH